MQVNETLAEGLKRELRVTIPASELDAKLADQLDQLKSRVRIKGFRPGKVPTTHLRRVYGKAAMAEIVRDRRRREHPPGDCGARRARRHAAQGGDDRGRD
jgi:FKBP-type peptidyl-prolyl cis-trans isomerase (trigger factor)